MTDEQFAEFMSMMQGQMQAQTDALKSVAEALTKLKSVEILNTALSLCKTRSTENTPLQEQGGLVGAIEDIGKFIDESKMPDNWKDYITNEIYIKTFSGKPLKVDEI